MSEMPSYVRTEYKYDGLTVPIYQITNNPTIYNRIESLDEYGLIDIIRQYRMQWVAYCYSCGDNEGGGPFLFRSRNRWYDYDMSHCSCHGPLEYFTTSAWRDLVDLQRQISPEKDSEMYPLVLVAKEKFKEWEYISPLKKIGELFFF